MVDPLPETLLVPDMDGGGDDTEHNAGGSPPLAEAEPEAETAAAAPPAYVSVAEQPAEPAPTATTEETEEEAPPPTATATAAAAQPVKWAAQLCTLADMGFFDQERITTVLDETNGDVQRTIERLLS